MCDYMCTLCCLYGMYLPILHLNTSYLKDSMLLFVNFVLFCWLKLLNSMEYPLGGARKGSVCWFRFS